MKSSPTSSSGWKFASEPPCRIASTSRASRNSSSNGNRKATPAALSEFLEYLDYFDQAGGTVSLEDDVPGDAVQLMTVHGAKGLEFPHVFLLRLNNNAFPASERIARIRIPRRTHERRRPRGAISHSGRAAPVLRGADPRAGTLDHHRAHGKKRQDPHVRRRHAHGSGRKAPQRRAIAPRLAPREIRSVVANGAAATLFPAAIDEPRIFSRIAEWAETFHPPSSEPLQLSPSAIDNYRRCPQQYLFGRLWSLQEGPRGTMTFGRVIHDTIRRAFSELRKRQQVAVRRSAADFRNGMEVRGF